MRCIPHAALASLLTVALAMPARGEPWEIYQPGSAGFRIAMPAAFDRQDYGSDGSISVEASRGGITYAVRHRPYQDNGASADAALDAARDDSLRRAGGLRLGRELRLTVGDAPAREWTLLRADGAVAGLRRLMLTASRLVEAAVDGPSGIEAAGAPRWFLDSLASSDARHADQAPQRSYVVCFNGQPCGGQPCPSISALELDSGQEMQGVYFDLGGLPRDATPRVSDEDMFKGRMVVVGRMTSGQVAENRGYPLLRVAAVARQAQAAERRHCAVRD